MIRAASREDLSACLAMGREFHSEAGLREIPFDDESVLSTLEHLMAEGGLFVSVDQFGEYCGMVGGLQYQHYANSAIRVAQELFWWVRPDKRGGTAGMRLKEALSKWAREGGCQALVMVCLPIDSPAESVYLRLGYRPMEHSYIKGL